MKSLLHRFICWYLARRCGGAFHCHAYGPAGRYVQLLTEEQYAEFQRRRRGWLTLEERRGLLESLLRSNPRMAAEVMEKVERTVMGLAQAAGAPEPELQYYYGTAAGYNDPELVTQVREVVRRELGAEADLTYPPGMGGEDFAYFGREVPGFQFRLGVLPPGAEPMSLHRANFDPDERALALGIQVAAAAIWDQMERGD